MRIHVREIDLFLTDCDTRIPFRFGVSTLTSAPLCTARVTIETDAGARAEGLSSDLLVPKWFEKDPKKSAEGDIRALIASARDAADELLDGATPGTVFEHWWTLYRERVVSADPAGGDLLVRGFGVALMERALMDAVCRATRTPFASALRDDLFGFEPSVILPELESWDVASSLPGSPVSTINVRHTVGLLDALTADGARRSGRIEDGLPESLEEDIRVYGLRYFKVKLCGQHDDDLARLHDIAGVIDRAGVERPRFTIDGNEQFDELEQLVAMFEALAASPSGAPLLDRLLYVEQPLARTETFESAPNAAMGRLNAFAPVIIDEADCDLGAFPRAIELGYRGVSVKNCKGVFRALLNRGLCERSGGTLFQAAEDLTNLPVIALQQDLATVAALGLTHVERNGHHYFRGLDHLPPEEITNALQAHPDLYLRDARGARLRIHDGRLELGSLQRPGYGYDIPIDCACRTRADDWIWSRTEP